MNKLQHIAEFKTLLRNYQTSAETKNALKRTNFVALAAISSAGRNTMIRELLKGDNYHFVVSDTTRKPRVNDGVIEQDGREYWFKTEEQFLDGLKKGEYVEAAIIHNQQVSGVSVRELIIASDKDQIAISDIDVQGVDRLYSYAKSCIPVFVLPPSYQEWRQRLEKRGKMTNKELANRLSSAKMELEHALSKDYYHFLVNNSLSEAIKGLDKIAHGKLDPKHEEHGRQVARQILHDLNTGTLGH